MKRYSALLPVAALALAACADGPTGIRPDAAISGEMVITPGIAVPKSTPKAQRPLLSAVSGASASVGGSSTTPLIIQPQNCGGTATYSVQITYTVTGAQAGTSTFDVPSRWAFNGSTWSPVAGNVFTVTVPPRAPSAPASTHTATIVLENPATPGSAPTSFTFAPGNFTNTNATGAKLETGGGSVTVHAGFAACPVTNTPPVLTIPVDMTVEATSSAGASVTFSVPASDAQDGDLTAAVVCTPASGSTFPLGETTVNCSVTDAGGLTATGSFKVNVVDTTPAYFTSFPSGTLNAIAANSAGAAIDLDTLGITVADVDGVSEPSTWSCDYVAGTVLAIGSTTTISCTAKDAIGNESAPSTFSVFVGLNVSATGFLPPLRMASPFSAHKRGSTIPHKFLPPTYADGTPAIDLASGLRLVVQRISGVTPDAEIEVNDFTAGSTEWRYDPTAGQYVFNLKTQTAWELGMWKTTVSYAGIPLASTQFELRR